MSKPKFYNTDQAPSSPNILSQATEYNGIVFTSGQIHLTSDMELVEGTIEKKTQQIMKNLEEILKEADIDFSHVIKANVFVTDMSVYSEFNEVYMKYFEAPFPAREVVCVKELPLGADIEVSLVASREKE